MSFPEPVQSLVNPLTCQLAGASRRYQQRLRDLRERLREPAVPAAGGTWIASPQAIAACDWDDIRERPKAATLIAVEARTQKEATQ